MTRYKLLPICAVLALALCTSPALALAQSAKPASADDTRDVNLRAYAELLRSDLRAQKIAIITEVMEFTEAEDAKFWPVYREYETELAKINDDRIALIKEYAAQLRDADRRDGRPPRARALDLEARRHALTVSYYERFKAVLLAEDGRPIPPGRAPDPAAPRPADRGVATHRPVNSDQRKQPCADRCTLFSTFVAVVTVGVARCRPIA